MFQLGYRSHNQNCCSSSTFQVIYHLLLQGFHDCHEAEAHSSSCATLLQQVYLTLKMKWHLKLKLFLWDITKHKNQTPPYTYSQYVSTCPRQV